MIDLAPWQWALRVICGYLSGVSKTGVPGLGILVVPLMALMVGNAKQSTGWLLPILCTADVFAVYQWRKHSATWRLFSLAPWVALGMITGTAALSFNERVLRPIIATVILTMLSLFIVRRYGAKHREEVPSHGPTYGIFAGFATTIASSHRELDRPSHPTACLRDQHHRFCRDRHTDALSLGPVRLPSGSLDVRLIS